MKKRRFLFVCILLLSMFLTAASAKSPIMMKASTMRQMNDTYNYSTDTFKKDNAIGKYIKNKNLSDSFPFINVLGDHMEISIKKKVMNNK